MNKIDLNQIQARLTSISSDGKIDEDEKVDFLDIVNQLEKVQEQIEGLKLLAEKIGGV